MNIRTTILIICTPLIFGNCKKREAPPPPPKKSSEKNIYSFTFYKSDNPLLSQDVAGIISNDTISFTLSSSADTAHLIPTILYKGVSLKPSSKTVEDFSNPVVYTVTAEDGSSIAYKTVSRILSDEKRITGFVFQKINNPGLPNDITCSISGDSIIGNVSPGIDITALKPTIAFKGASISPDTSQVANFTSLVSYYVTAQDGSVKGYSVFLNGNSYVFIHGDDGYVYAFDGNTRFFLWSYNTGGNGAPTYENGVVFVAGNNAVTGTVIYAINASDGSLKWSRNESNFSLSMPVAKNGKVYFGGNGFVNYTANPGDGAYFAGFVLALDEQTGEQAWISPYYTSNTPVSLYNTNVTVDDNIACIYDELYGFRAFNASDGSALLSGIFGELGRTNPAIGSNSIVCGIELGIAEYDFSGNLIWRIINGVTYTSPTININDGTVYTSTGGAIYAIDAGGNIKWQTSAPGPQPIFYSPLYCNNYLYVPNSWGIMSCYDASVGSLVWTQGNLGIYPVIADNKLWACNIYHALTCLNATTGSLEWISNQGSVFSGPACVVDTKDVAHYATESGGQN